MKISCAVLATAVLCTACTTLPQSPRDQLASSLRTQIARCWSPPAPVAATTYRPRFMVRLKTDGALDGTPRLTNPSDDPAAAALAASAVAALKSCSPFSITPNLVDYEQWKKLGIVFDVSSP